MIFVVYIFVGFFYIHLTAPSGQTCNGKAGKRQEISLLNAIPHRWISLDNRF